MTKVISYLQSSKESMYHTLETKVEGFKKRVSENIFEYEVEDERVHLIAITRFKDFKDHLNFSYIHNSLFTDNDLLKTKALAEKTTSKNVQSNNAGIILGYALIERNIKFLQALLTKRNDFRINNISFNKQIPKSKTHPSTFFDKRKLEITELAIWALARNLELPDEESEHYVKHKGIYHSKIDFFNLNKEEGIIESGWYRDIADPKQFRKNVGCYFCNDTLDVHEECKKTSTYLDVVIPRQAARSHKHFLHQDAFINANGKYELELNELKKDFLTKHSSNPIRPFKTYKVARFKNVPFSNAQSDYLTWLQARHS